MSDLRPALPARGAVLVRGAYVMTMGPAGDLPLADVLLRDGMIVEIGRDIEAADVTVIDGDDMMALPGFVDTHWHLWNSTLRGFISYVDPANTYFPLTMRLGPLSTAHDAFCNVRLALAEALLCGITTIHNWAHNVRSPSHADAELRGMRDMGVRGRFSYGWGQDLPVDQAMDADDLRRLSDELKADPLITLGAALRTPVAYQRGNVPIEVLQRDCTAARKLGLPLTMHNRPGAVSLLEQHGMLGKDLLLVHPQGFSADELSWLSSREVRISCSPIIENARGPASRGPIQLSEMLAMKIPTGISIDEVATGGKADFFAVMRELVRSDWQRAGEWTKLTARRVLELATIDGARTLGLGDQVGSLEPGKKADLILIRLKDVNMVPASEDPAMSLVFSGQPSNVDTVIADGRLLVQGGRPQFDLQGIILEAAQSARELRERDRGMAAKPSRATG